MISGHHTNGDGNATGRVGIGRPHTHSSVFRTWINLNTTEQQFQQHDDNTFNLNDNHYFQ
jgi:hypothetical protein